MIDRLAHALGLIMFYLITGFGPGVILGFIIANRTGGRHFEHHDHNIEKALRQAAEHNAQWHPEHQRWQR